MADDSIDSEIFNEIFQIIEKEDSEDHGKEETLKIVEEENAENNGEALKVVAEEEELPLPPCKPPLPENEGQNAAILGGEISEENWESKIKKTEVYSKLMDANYVIGRLKRPEKVEELDDGYLSIYGNLSAFSDKPFYIIFDELHFRVPNQKIKALTIIGTSVDGQITRILSVRLNCVGKLMGSMVIAIDLTNVIHAVKCLKLMKNLIAVVCDHNIANVNCRKVLDLPMLPDYTHLLATIQKKFNIVEKELQKFLNEIKLNENPNIDLYLQRVPERAEQFYRSIFNDYVEATKRMKVHHISIDFSEANTVKLEHLGFRWKRSIQKACSEAGSFEIAVIIRIIALLVAETQEQHLSINR